MTDLLHQDIMYAPGVGPKRKEMLSKELGIQTFGQLLEHYPYKYIDRRHIYRISELLESMSFIQVKGRILSFESFETGRRSKRLVAVQRQKDIQALKEIRSILFRLREAYAQIADVNTSGPVMSNSESVYAGLTYGRGTLNEDVVSTPNRGFLA